MELGQRHQGSTDDTGKTAAQRAEHLETIRNVQRPQGRSLSNSDGIGMQNQRAVTASTCRGDERTERLGESLP